MVPIEEIFCEIDDFCKRFFPAFERGLLLDPSPKTGEHLLHLGGVQFKLHWTYVSQI
ncbi:hypothetical protein GCM10011332_26570 [Terasakiella brassicae]|uniref:Uncharacterized protein n=1 Tax=Terasakiella brassicae TaxID=1634917 RepID=A0A917C6D6_9PROT|nr:hypothetical protein GCM10011332_26570 [Terasakiella brassicae]